MDEDASRSWLIASAIVFGPLVVATALNTSWGGQIRSRRKQQAGNPPQNPGED